MVTKRSPIRGTWKLNTLTREEEEIALSGLLEDNLKELIVIIQKLKEAKERFPELEEIETVEIVKMLFDKQATASFTRLGETLEKKIEKLNKPDSKIEETFRKTE